MRKLNIVAELYLVECAFEVYFIKYHVTDNTVMEAHACLYEYHACRVKLAFHAIIVDVT